MDIAPRLQESRWSRDIRYGSDHRTSWAREFLSPSAPERHRHLLANGYGGEGVHHGSGDGDQPRLRQLRLWRSAAKPLPYAPVPTHGRRVATADGGKHAQDGLHAHL